MYLYMENALKSLMNESTNASQSGHYIPLICFQPFKCIPLSLIRFAVVPSYNVTNKFSPEYLPVMKDILSLW